LLPITVPERIELLGGLLISAGLEQLIELRDDFRLELAAAGDGRADGQSGRLSAAETHMNRDRVGFEKRYVLDQQRQHAFALDRFGA
jgi:hypothetical protein